MRADENALDGFSDVYDCDNVDSDADEKDDGDRRLTDVGRCAC